MSGRCKSCDEIMSEQEMRTHNPENGAYLELCFNCLTETKLAEEGYYDNHFNNHFVVSDFGLTEHYKE
jgi:hypothetical protein